MNLLKSIFISSYMMEIMGITGYAGWMLYQGDNQSVGRRSGDTLLNSKAANRPPCCLRI